MLKPFKITYTKTIILYLGILVFLNACATVNVSSLIGGRHKHDYAQNFESMQTYNLNPAPAVLAANKDYIFIQNSGAQLAIENAMAGKKIRKERHLMPDFKLNYYFTGKQGISTGQLNQLFNYNLGLAWDDIYGTGKGIANNSHHFSGQTFIIDFVSRNNNRLIWRGSAPTGISLDDNENDIRTSLDKAIEVILDPFPPENNFESLKSPVFNE